MHSTAQVPVRQVWLAPLRCEYDSEFSIMWSLKHSAERQPTRGLYLSSAGSTHRKELRVVTLPQLLANSTDTMKEELLQRPAATQPKKRRDVFYFAHTRTASHVLCRLLSTQPGWEQSDYHFKCAFDFARDTFGWGPLNDASKQQREGFEKLLQQGFDEIQDEREAAANKVGRPICAVSFARFTVRPSLTRTEQGFLPQRTHILHMGAFSTLAKHVGRVRE
jgi:hypothetical protein